MNGGVVWLTIWRMRYADILQNAHPYSFVCCSLVPLPPAVSCLCWDCRLLYRHPLRPDFYYACMYMAVGAGSVERLYCVCRIHAIPRPVQLTLEDALVRGPSKVVSPAEGGLPHPARRAHNPGLCMRPARARDLCQSVRRLCAAIRLNCRDARESDRVADFMCLWHPQRTELTLALASRPYPPPPLLCPPRPPRPRAPPRQ